MPSRITDAFRSLPVDLPDKDLDFTSLKELPDPYVWTDQLDSSPPPPSSESVPVIDLNDPNALQLIGSACKTWGAFQVINHGIPATLFEEAESTCRDLFTLPTEQKLKAARSPDGICGYGLARISPFFSKLMWYEGFTVVGSPADHFRQLWSQDYNKYCEVIEEYQKEMKRLVGRLAWLMLGSLGITKEDIKWAGPKGNFKDASGALQLNYYPACPDPDRAMGLPKHTDSTLLTILFQNKISGLQVLKEGSGWVTVPPVPGGLVIHVGDLLHILSNGSYPSVVHRAVVNRNTPRFSMAWLQGPPEGVKVSPLQKLVDSSHPALYSAVTWSEYLRTKAKHFDKALSSVRVCVPKSELVDVN